MKKQRKTPIKKHKRALKAAKRKKTFARQKHLWNLGIGLYDKEEKRN